jgi:hypothetical protein
MKIDGEFLTDMVHRLRESMHRKELASLKLRHLYKEARKEFGISTERLELEIIKYRESIGRKPLGAGRIYFLRVPQDSLVKIGVTRFMPTRLKALAGNIRKPTELVGSIEGDDVTERVIHWQFRQHRQHGEFFSWVPISEQVRGMIARNSGLLREHLQ